MKTELRQPYATFFGTLANQYRLDIINLLLKGPKNVTEICNHLKMKQPTVSKNLRRLEHCGFVTSKQSGKVVVYTLNSKTIKPLTQLMNKHMDNYCSKIAGCDCR